MQRPSWLITGAGGFLGANLALGLGDVHTIGTSRHVPPAGLFDEWHRANLSSVPDLVTRLRPAVVVNCAALSSHEACEHDPELAHAVNASAAGAVAVAAARAGAGFVQISTDAVFAGDRGNYRESDAPAPFSAYGRSKAAGEEAVLAACPEALVVRTNFFGWSPSGTRSILEFFTAKLRAGEPVLGYADFVVTSIYAGQLVAVLSALVQRGARGIVHVASSDAQSKLAFGQLVATAFDLDASLITASSAAAGGHDTSRARDLSLDITLAASLLGSPMPSQEAGVLAARAAETRTREQFGEPSPER